jgi:hypothetical protein
MTAGNPSGIRCWREPPLQPGFGGNVALSASEFVLCSTRALHRLAASWSFKLASSSLKAMALVD